MEAEKQTRRNAQTAANAKRNNQMLGVILGDGMKIRVRGETVRRGAKADK
jgi:hypothetical protein